MALPLSKKQLQAIANQDFVKKDVQSKYGQDTVKDETFNISALKTPTPAPAPTGKFKPPEPVADTTRDSFFTSLTGAVDTTRTSLEKTYKSELDQIEKGRTKAQAEIDRYTDMQETLIDRDIEPLLKPFREELETSERKRLYVDKNFHANQKLTDELETLLNEGNELIRVKKEQPIPLSLQNRQVNKTMADVSARAGVIQAVMNARSGQIAEAYRMIDRSVGAITADRQDELSYYKTVYNFYQEQKDSEGAKLLNLDKRQEQFVERQIGLLEHDLAQAEANANHIKSLMTSPESAQFMADAGVTLNDTPEQVAGKLAEQSRRQEAQDLKNELTAKGYTFIPFPSSTAGLKTFQVGGQTLAFKEPPVATGGGSGFSNQMTDNERALFGQFRSEPIVKDYNTILAKKLTVERIISQGLGGPGDLALVYEFMKGLDPTSVVRETEYASAAKSGNIFSGAMAQFNGYFKPEGGFLPPQVQQAFKSIVDSKFAVQTDLYNNVSAEYRDIAARQGLNPDNVALGYNNAAPPLDDGEPDSPSYDDAVFDEVVPPQSGPTTYLGRLWNAIIGN